MILEVLSGPVCMVAAHVSALGVHLAEDGAPDDNKVVAGGTGAVVFVLLILAVILLSRSLVTRLRNAARSEDEGRYDPSEKTRDAAGYPVPPKEGRGLSARKPPVR